MEREIINLDHSVSIEVIPSQHKIYIARLHENGMRYGDDWSSSLVLEVDDNVCYAHAGLSKLEGGFSHKKTKSIVMFLRSKGVRCIRYSKIKNGAVTTHELVI